MAVKINGKTIWGINDKQVEYVKANYHKTTTQINKELGIKAHSAVSDVIRALGLRKRYTSTKIPHDRISEYNDDLKDPRLSHERLARKWKVTGGAIGLARKRCGLGVWRTNQTSVLEEQVVEMLDELDIAYIRQKRFDKWSSDFYLGHKLIVDVHGEWAHSIPKNIERDLRKVAWLSQQGYSYLVIHEYELTEPNLVKTKLETFFWASLGSNASIKNFVNPEAQGCPSNEGLTVEPRVGNTVPSLESNLFEGVETIPKGSRLENELPVEALSPQKMG